jgi:hypothetical protein
VKIETHSRFSFSREGDFAMKKIALCSMALILVALLATGCGAKSTPVPVGPGGGQPGGSVQIDFGADSTMLQPGQCTNLHWNVQGGISVRLDGQPVDPTGQKQVCPNATTTYRLEADAGGRVEAREVTIQVGGGNGPAPANRPGGESSPAATSTVNTGGGGQPAATPTVKTGGGGGGGGTVPTHTPATAPTIANGDVDIGIYYIIIDQQPGSPNKYNINVFFRNYGSKKWSKSDDPSSSGDLEFSCSRSFTVDGKISTSTYDGSVPRDQIDDPEDEYFVTPWWIDMTGVTAITITCWITKGPTYDSNSSNNNKQYQWG